MPATIPRKALVYLGIILVALAFTACGGADESATGPGTPAGPAAPSPYVEAISPIISSVGQSLGVVEDQLAALTKASLDSTYVSANRGGGGPEGLMQVFTDGAAVLAQEGTTLEGLEGQLAQISPPNDASRYHKELSEYVGMMKEGVREVGQWFERQDVMCCVTMAIGSWEQQGVKADIKRDEINAEARGLGYPEID